MSPFKVPFFELTSELRTIKPEVNRAIKTVFDRGQFILGPEVGRFEEEFAQYIGVNHCVGVASGTEAIQLALMAVGVKPGDEVITAANTCVPTVCGIYAAGARPVLADIDPVTMTLDAQSAAKMVTAKTTAVVPVHLYGHPCHLDSITGLAADCGLAVVEDCAQAHGASYRGRRCGSWGQAAAFSFYPTKNLGAYGDAGAVTTNDEQVAAALRSLRNYGEERRYYHSRPGLNSRLDELQAAVLRVKLQYLDEWNLERQIRANCYQEELRYGFKFVLPLEVAPAKHAYHLYVIRLSQRDDLQSWLTKAGIGTLIHYPVPIHLQEAYHFLGYQPGDFPQAEQACREVLSLPLHPFLKREQIERVVESIRHWYYRRSE